MFFFVYFMLQYPIIAHENNLTAKQKPGPEKSSGLFYVRMVETKNHRRGIRWSNALTILFPATSLQDVFRILIDAVKFLHEKNRVM